MGAWSRLPYELQFEIVKRMDITTRFRFRHVSHSTLRLVDETPLLIPSVCIHMFKDTYIEMTVYESTKQAKHMEFTMTDPEKPNYFKSYTYNPNTITEAKFKAMKKSKGKSAKYLVDYHPVISVMLVLKSLCVSPKTVIGWLHYLGGGSIEARMETITVLREVTIRANIILFQSEGQTYPILKRCSEKDLREVRIVERKILRDPEGGPDLEMVRTKCMVPGIRYYASSDVEGTEDMYPQMICEYNNENLEKECEEWNEKIGPGIYLTDKGQGKLHFYSNSCGMACRSSQLNMVEEDSDPAKCRNRWSCKKCTDPFEYWFFNSSIQMITGGQLDRRLPIPQVELIMPTVNGVDPVKKFLASLNSTGTDKFEVFLTKEKYRFKNRAVIPPERSKWRRVGRNGLRLAFQVTLIGAVFYVFLILNPFGPLWIYSFLFL